MVSNFIEKIIKISNIGHFVNYKFDATKAWDGQLKKVNVVYAPNGSGKTTLSTILKSLATNDPKLIDFKKTFGSEEESEVEIKASSSGSLIRFKNNNWSSNDLKIEVFDINYIEEYLFAGSFFRKQSKTNLFKLILGDEGIKYRNRLKVLFGQKKLLLDLQKRKVGFVLETEELKLKLIDFQKDIDLVIAEYQQFSTPIFENHISIVNKYLTKFTSYVRIVEFTSAQNANENEHFRIYPVFEVYGEKIIFSAPDPQKRIGNARYALSEGDKSAIALSFFLARLEIQGYSNKIIVFDDPLSSFDYARKNATIFQLARIADTAQQFILLTHDLNFANDYTDKCSHLEPLNLKIETDGKTSSLQRHNLGEEYLTSTQKDIEVIKQYLEKPSADEYVKREVIRCIRPVLEGVIKTKYFDVIARDKWLGDIINAIKVAQPGSKLLRLKELRSDLIELNDYTKGYHHASASDRGENINAAELKRYVDLLMKIILEV